MVIILPKENLGKHFILFYFKFILRERVYVNMGGKEKERESQAGSVLSAQSPTRGLNP